MGGAASMNSTAVDVMARFNAARGFVGGAAVFFRVLAACDCCFNAARGFVGGAASSLSALVPLRGKRPFGKSPEI